MSMRKDIQNAFDKVHAPDELVERMKQELYQKDLHEDIEEITFSVKQAPRRNYLRGFAIVAAALALCIGCGVSVLSLRENPFNPASSVVATTEETTEPDTSRMAAEKEAYEQMQYDMKLYEQEGSQREAEKNAYQKMQHDMELNEAEKSRREAEKAQRE